MATPRGTCFFIRVKAFSSLQLRIVKDEATSPWRWSLDADLLRHVVESRSPFVLFVFDADTDLGRFLRLDSLPSPGPDVRTLNVVIPASNSLDKDGLSGLVSSLDAEDRGGPRPEVGEGSYGR